MKDRVARLEAKAEQHTAFTTTHSARVDALGDKIAELSQQC